MRTRHAFSLLELSAVLAILALLLGFGINIGQNAVRGSERLATQEKLATIQAALDAYAERNGYLPCPASPALVPGATGFGVESRSTTTGAGCATMAGVTVNSGVWYGMVPVANLALDASFASDSWDNKITYAVSNAHTGLAYFGMNSYAEQTGTLEIRSGMRATYLTLTTQTTGIPGPAATYAVISHGKNGRGAYPITSSAVGTACGSDTTLIEVENCDRSGTVFFDSDYNEGTQAALQFDDYIVWGSNMTARDPLTPLTNSCPGTTCQSWCAPCRSTGTSAPPVFAPSRVCAKIITKTSPNCEALCIWPNSNNPCP